MVLPKAEIDVSSRLVQVEPLSEVEVVDISNEIVKGILNMGLVNVCESLYTHLRLLGECEKPIRALDIAKDEEEQNE